MDTTSAESTAHLDVLIVGAGLSGIGAGHYLQTDLRGPTTRSSRPATPSVGRGTSSVIPACAPIRTCSRSAIRSGPGTARTRSSTASRSCSTSRTPPGVRRRSARSVPPSDHGGQLVDARFPLAHHRPTDDTGQSFEITASFLFCCSGYYRYDHGYLPDFDGTADFAGSIVHPQAWPPELDVSGKKVVVIGSGATAVTLVPALARAASHVTMLQRSPSYIPSLPEKSPVVAALRKVLPAQQAGTAAKWFHALLTQAFYAVSRKYPTWFGECSPGSGTATARGYDIATHFTPRYDPWDQRFCAVPTATSSRLCQTARRRWSRTRRALYRERPPSLVGHQLEADVVVTATGLELLFLGGIALSVDGAPSTRPPDSPTRE